MGGKLDLIEWLGAAAPLDGPELIALCLQVRGRVQPIFVIRPAHPTFRPQSSLRQFGVGRGGGNATQVQMMDTDPIGGAKDTTNGMGATDVLSKGE